MPITPEQRAARRAHVGASDVPALLGVDPFRTATDIFWSKVSDPPPERETPSQLVGNKLEAVLVAFAAERLGIADRVQSNVHLLHEGGVLAANLDAIDPESGDAIEAKVSAKDAGDWGIEGTDQVPLRVLVQCQAQIACGAACVWVPALVVDYAPRFALYRVAPHPEVIDIIVQKATGFWRDHVLAGVPPDGVLSPPLDILKAMERGRFAIRLDEEALPIVENWEEAVRIKHGAEQAEAEAKRQVLALLGDADEALLSDGRRLTFFTQRSTPSVDYTMLRARFTEAYAECVSQGQHRRLLVRRK